MHSKFFRVSLIQHPGKKAQLPRISHAKVTVGFNGAETNCGIAHILGILLMRSCNTDTSFSNYYNLKSVRFELKHSNQKYMEDDK